MIPIVTVEGELVRFPDDVVTERCGKGVRLTRVHGEGEIRIEPDTRLRFKDGTHPDVSLHRICLALDREVKRGGAQREWRMNRYLVEDP